MTEIKDVLRPEPVVRKLFFSGLGWTSGLVCFLKAGMGSLFIILAFTLIFTVFVIAFWNNAAPVFIGTALKYSGYVFLVLCCSLLSIIFFRLYFEFRYKPALQYAGSEVSLTGVITDISYVGGDSVRLTVKGKINGETPVKISFYTADRKYDYYDEITADLTVKIPENAISFEAEDYYRSLGVYLTGSGSAECYVSGECQSAFMRFIKRFRSYMTGKICSAAGGDAGGFLTAVFCSDKSHISYSAKTAVYRAGLGHLFAVSGTHIVMLASFSELVLAAVVSDRRFRSAFILIIIWSFALFAGMSASVVRAAVMTSISLSAGFFYRESDCANSLGAAAIVITLFNPFAITSVSFIMSFTASLAIGVFAPGLCGGRIKSRVGRIMVSYLCISICSIPICAAVFSEISLISVISNLILIPACTFCLILVFIFAVSGAHFYPAAVLAGAIARIIIILCEKITDFSFTYVGTYFWKAISAVSLVSLAFLIYNILKKNKKPVDILNCAAVYAVMCAALVSMSNIEIKDRIIIIPDTNGFCAVVLKDGGALLFDMGDSADDYYTAARLLEEMNISEISVFLSEDVRYCYASYSEHLSADAVFYSYGYNDEKILPAEESGCVWSDGEAYKTFLCGREILIGFDGIQIDSNAVYANDTEEITTIVF